MQKTRNFKSPMLRKQKGFTLVEIAIVIVMGAVIVLTALEGVTVIQEKRKVSQAVTQVTQVYQAASDWRATRSSYTGISMTVLNDRKLLPSTISTGTSVNPWGGNISIAANGSNVGLVDITFTNVPTGVSSQLEDKLEPSSSGGNTASVSGTTVTVSYE